MDHSKIIDTFDTYHWPIIKKDLLEVFKAFFRMDFRGFGCINQAQISLLLKKPDALEVKDFRPVSLIHSLPKLLAKAMATRLASDFRGLLVDIRARSSEDDACMKTSCWCNRPHGGSIAPRGRR